MNTLILITIAVFVIWVTFKQYVTYKRLIFHNELVSVYDKIEFFIASNRIRLDSENVRFFSAYKNLVVNPEIADIRILMSLVIINKDHRWVEQSKVIRKGFDEELQSLLDQFEKINKKIVKLSFYKPGFVLFTLRLVFKELMKNGFKKMYNPVILIKLIVKKVRYSLTNGYLELSNSSNQFALN